MIWAYIVIAIILGIIVTAVGAMAFFDGVNDRDDLKLWAAAVTLGYLVALIWPLVIPLAILGLMGYGLYNVPNLIRTIRADMKE